MAFQILTTLFIMVAWLLFTNHYTFGDVLSGLFVGAIVVRIVTYFNGEPYFLKRGVALAKLIYIFFRELTIANYWMVSLVFSPRLNLTPGIIGMETKLKTGTEKALFGVMMALIPGTMPLEFSDDGKMVYVHTVDASDVNRIIEVTKRKYERAILEVTRPDAL